MQLVSLGFNGPRFQKVFCHKRLTQITKSTSKNAINELSKHHRWSRGHKSQGQEHKKIRDQGQEQLFREQTLSRSRAGMLEAKAKDQEHSHKRTQEASVLREKKVFKSFFRQSKKKQQSLQPHFSADRQKKRSSRKFFKWSTKF